MTDKKEPKSKVRFGSISVTTWENEKEGKNGKFKMLSHQVEKNYKDGEEWKKTNSVNTEELLAVSMACKEAWRKAKTKEEGA